MQYITSITSDPYQSFTVETETGTQIEVTLKWLPSQYMWIMSVSTPSIEINTIQVVLHPNILREWRNNIDFGFSIICDNGVEPCSLYDFVNERVKMYLLEQSEVEEVENLVYGR